MECVYKEVTEGKGVSFMMNTNVYSVLYRICSNEIGKKFGKEVTQYD